MELLLNSFYNLLISVFFLWHTFLSFFFFYLHHCCLLNSYVFSLLIQQILSWFNPITLLFFPLGSCLFNSRTLKCQALFQHLLQRLCKYLLFLYIQWVCLYPYNKILHSTMFWFHIIIPKFIHYSFTQI